MTDFIGTVVKFVGQGIAGVGDLAGSAISRVLDGFGGFVFSVVAKNPANCRSQRGDEAGDSLVTGIGDTLLDAASNRLGTVGCRLGQFLGLVGGSAGSVLGLVHGVFG